MILGIGNDLVNMERIYRSITRFGDRMICRIYTPNERAYARSRPDPVKAFASRFAAKEALVKALGTGIVSEGVSWQDIEIQKNSSGKPTIALQGRALEHFKALVPEGMRGRIHLSLSDEAPFAQAFVILSAEFNP